MIARGGLLAHAVGSVGEHDRGETETLVGRESPDVGTGQELGFLIQRHAGDDRHRLFRLGLVPLVAFSGIRASADGLHLTPRRSSRVARVSRALVSVIP